MAAVAQGVRLCVRGRVQGVGFRAYTEGCARRLGLRGYVRNQLDGSVEVHAEGSRQDLEAFVLQVQRGPSLSRVDECRPDWGEATGAYEGFRVRA